jgi:hypothetical protein
MFINSPGVQINEKDLSLRASTSTGTTVVVPGFASQGPSSEPLFITTVSELEQVYGIPTTPAERYFYYSCKQVLESPGTLISLRLPYGDSTGTDFAKAYSGLLFPMTSATNDYIQGYVELYNLTTAAATSATYTNWNVLSSVSNYFGATTQSSASALSSSWVAGISDWNIATEKTTLQQLSVDANYLWKVNAPTHVRISQSDYQKLKQGDFNWLSPTSTNSGNISNITAGLVVLNSNQTTVNEIGEGYYFGLADNSAVSTDSPNFDSIKTLKSVVSDALSTVPNSFEAISTSRLDFKLSATATDSAKGTTSISERLEKVGFAGFETDLYQDYISVGLFKIRRSAADASVLTLGITETYLGSLDYNRKNTNPSGGSLQSGFIETVVNQASPNIEILVNTNVSNVFDWSVNSPKPTSRVYISPEAKGLYPIGVYTPDARAQELTKVIGSVPSKLDRVLRTLETVEDSTVDVIIDAGLSTVYSMASGLSAFDDTNYVSSVDSLYDDWKAVTQELKTFAEDTRKDCVAIIDAPRPIFVSGKDTKVINDPSKNFTTHILNPLKTFFSGYESNYMATYGNWAKVADVFSGRNVWVPFSGFAAAIFAKNDATAYPWSAPAGLNRGTFSVTDIAFNPNQKQRDRLYEISVNPVVFFSTDGFTVMGQKTLQTRPTAFDRINVRRLFLTLERATQRALKYFVFEPNTEFTRTRLKNTISPIFDFAKNTEGLYDYLIVCDSRNNTPQTIDENKLVVDIYLKPVRTAEFLLVNFVATRTGQNFTELL